MSRYVPTDSTKLRWCGTILAGLDLVWCMCTVHAHATPRMTTPHFLHALAYSTVPGSPPVSTKAGVRSRSRAVPTPSPTPTPTPTPGLMRNMKQVTLKPRRLRGGGVVQPPVSFSEMAAEPLDRSR